MSDPAYALQVAVAAALLAHAEAAALVGTAVYSRHQAFADVFPRFSLEPPQVLPADGCNDESEAYLTVHSWARGPDATLVASQMAGAARAALDAPLSLDGHRISSHRFDGSRAVGDPDPNVEHVVSVFRYSTQPTG